MTTLLWVCWGIMLILEVCDEVGNPNVLILGPNHTIHKGANGIALINDHSRGYTQYTNELYEDLVYRISTITSVAQIKPHKAVDK